MRFGISELFLWRVFDFIVWMHNERCRTNRKSCYCGFKLMNCFENLLFDFSSSGKASWHCYKQYE